MAITIDRNASSAAISPPGARTSSPASLVTACRTWRVKAGGQIIEAPLEVVDRIARQAAGMPQRVLDLRAIGGDVRGAFSAGVLLDRVAV
jgi:hypothetical protein